ncbi:MAG: RDD family protein [Terriglobales bacterium]|jgi:uncharacterized RDD family membrane protein YckC
MSFSPNQLTIETPEQVNLEYQIAGIGSRFIAFLIDSLIQFLISFVVILAVIYGTPSVVATLSSIGEKWMLAIVIILFFLLYWGYFAFFEAIWKGQTPGKRNVGIRVMKETGRTITPLEAISRNFLRSIDQLPGFYVIGLITMSISPQHRRVGDYVAGTVVVHEKSAAPVDLELQDLSPTTEAIGISTANLNVSDLELIETFLHRRLSFEDNIRRATAMRISQYIQGKTQQPRDAQIGDEEFLQLIAKAIRSNTR